MKISPWLTTLLLVPALAANAQAPRPADMIDTDRPFDHYLWITTHNAANHSSLLPNQSMDVTAQLQKGIRGLMLDIHERDGKLLTCHADCAFHGRRAPLQEDLGAVASFLLQHPDAVVTLHLEDHYQRSTMEAFVRDNPLLFRSSFNPGDARWSGTPGRWPTLRELVTADQRLLILTQRSELSGSYAEGAAYFMHDQAVTAENYWSLGDTVFSHDNRCRPRWDHVALDATDRPLGFPRLFVMNHFHGVPFSPHSAADNRLDTVIDRLEQYCLPAARRMPSYLALDFIEWGDMLQFAETYNNGGLIAFDGNNGQGKPICTFSTAFNRSWSLYSTSRMGCENDAIRSVVLRGARAGQRVTLHEAPDGSPAKAYVVIDVLQDIAWDEPQQVNSLDADLDSAHLRVRHYNAGSLDGQVSHISVKAPDAT